MRIVSWNCRQGFNGKKPEVIKKFNADIWVIQECKKEDCEEPEKQWYGDGKEVNLSRNTRSGHDLGIGLFCKAGITITRLPEWNDSLSKNGNFRYIIPYTVEAGSESFTLFAVWTKNKTDKDDTLAYVQKVHEAIDHYKEMGLLNGQCILIGDFNSNEIWDKIYPQERNHSALIKKLENLGIKNCSNIKDYNTYYYYRNGEKGVLDDYCFATSNFKIISFGVGNRNYWKEYSDHCPIIVDFDF